MDPEKFPDAESVSVFLERNYGRLMDTNHQTYQDIRKEIERLSRLRDRYNNYIDEMCEALAIGAMLTAQMTADMIMEEFGIVLAGSEDDAEEEVEDDE